MVYKRLIAASAVVLVLLGVPAQACQPQKGFRVFDATLYLNKPALHEFGIEYLPSLSSFWRPYPPAADVPTVAMAKSAIGKDGIGATPDVFIDVEHWPLRGESSKVRESLVKYVELLRMVRQELPGKRIGLYGMMPIRDYWRAIRAKGSSSYREWQGENDRLGVLVKEVDALYPSLYTFYDDREGWQDYAIANLSEARRISQGKPIYAFLWPQYHDSNSKLRGKALPRDFWRLQLEVIRDHADGVVIWGGWKNGRMQWNNSMDWWRETLLWLGCDRG